MTGEPSAWDFDPTGPNVAEFTAPARLVATGGGLPDGPGVYVVTCGPCLAHIGESGHLATRIRELARLGVHHGASDVLCAAFCVGQPPMLRYEVLPSKASAQARERQLKDYYGEPPVPSDFARCRRAHRLRDRLLAAADANSWEAGYLEAVFAIGNSFRLILQPRFVAIWRDVGGLPPGPWSEVVTGDRRRNSAAPAGHSTRHRE